MKDDEIDLEQIEKYHKGLLNDEALKAFFEREKNDIEFSAKVKSYREIMDGISYFGKQKDFADSVTEWEKEIKKSEKTQERTLETSQEESEEKGSVFISQKKWYLAAAAAVILLIVSYVFLYRPPPSDPIAIFETYYQPYPNILKPKVRGEVPIGDTSREKAYMAYDDGDFKKAIEYFQEALTAQDDAEKDFILLYLGNCYLSMDSASAAKDILLLIDEQSNLANQAKWYLGLAYLKLEDLDNARSMLNSLTQDSTNSYYEDANQILRKINKL